MRREFLSSRRALRDSERERKERGKFRYKNISLDDKEFDDEDDYIHSDS